MTKVVNRSDCDLIVCMNKLLLTLLNYKLQCIALLFQLNKIVNIDLQITRTK